MENITEQLRMYRASVLTDEIAGVCHQIMRVLVDTARIDVASVTVGAKRWPKNQKPVEIRYFTKDHEYLTEEFNTLLDAARWAMKKAEKREGPLFRKFEL